MNGNDGGAAGGGGTSGLRRRGGYWQGSSLFMEQKRGGARVTEGGDGAGFRSRSPLTAFSMTQRAWCRSPEQQQDVLPFARSVAPAFGTPGVTPGSGAAAPLTRTQNSFYSVTDIVDVYAMSLSSDVLATSVYL